MKNAKQKIKILVDRSIEVNFVLTENVQVPQLVKWGNFEQTLNIVGSRLKRSYYKKADWYWQEVLKIPTVINLHQAGEIEFFTYSELNYEAWRSSSNTQICQLGDLRRNVKYTHVAPAIEKSHFISSVRSNRDDKELNHFLEFLLRIKFSDFKAKAPSLISRLSVFDIGSFEDLERFKKICSSLSKVQRRDAFHLWTAERNGLDGFLTLDKKFINAITETSRLATKAPPMLPSQLLSTLGIESYIPFPIAKYATYDFFGRIIDSMA